MPSKPCVTCLLHKPIFSQGKCRPCFASWGLANHVPENEMPPKCGVENCTGYVEKRGMCDIHYRRFVKYGHADKVRQQGKSEIRKRPYYNNWIHFKHMGDLAPEWLDFETFETDIGARPSDRHRLMRVNRDVLLGPGNFEWKEPAFPETFKHTQEETKAYNAAYSARKRDNGETFKHAGLSRFFGITVEHYNELLAAQNGTCALCDVTHDFDAKGKPQSLAVDHDHTTFEIRGLLCRHHNMMLGHAKDNPDVLRKGADYLERDTHTGWFAPGPGSPAGERKANIRSPAVGKTCSEEGCDKAVKAKNLCTVHYARLVRTGSTELKYKEVPSCTIEGCSERAVGRGLCGSHYYKLYYSKRPKADNPTPS